MSGGVTLAQRPPGIQSRAWPSPALSRLGRRRRWWSWGSPIPGHGRNEISRWALAGVVVAIVLAFAGGTAAKVAAPARADSTPDAPAVSCSAPGTGGGLTAEQVRNATTIIATGKAMGVPERAQMVALATAMQESSLVNNPGGDRDSAGLFQQRPSKGWGTYSQVTDPAFSARTFYKRLLALPGWDDMAVTVAAQRVQRSAYPNAYAKWEPAARALVGGTSCRTT